MQGGERGAGGCGSEGALAVVWGAGGQRRGWLWQGKQGRRRTLSQSDPLSSSVEAAEPERPAGPGACGYRTHLSPGGAPRRPAPPPRGWERGRGRGCTALPPQQRGRAGLSRRGTLSPARRVSRTLPTALATLRSAAQAPRVRPAAAGAGHGRDGERRAVPPAPPRPGHVRDAHTGGTPAPGTDPGQRCCRSRPGAARRARPAGSLVGSGRTPGGASFRRRSPAEPRLDPAGGCCATLSDAPGGLGLRRCSARLAPAGCPIAGPASSAEPRRLCCLAGTRLARGGRLKGRAQCSFTAPERGLQPPSEGSPLAATGFTETPLLLWICPSYPVTVLASSGEEGLLPNTLSLETPQLCPASN